MKAVDEGSGILGEDSVKQAFYYHIEKRSKTKREEIPQNLEVFHDALVDLFYQGAWILERRMARSLYRMLGLEFEVNDKWTLADYVRHAELNAGRASSILRS